MIISLIAVVDEKFGLGMNNALLCHLPADLQHFKSVTMGKPIIMGRKTFESIGKPLPGRMNIVLSRQHLMSEGILEGILVVDSLDAALNLIKENQEVMIIGGAQIYEQAMVHADRIYLTIIHHQFTADVHFPSISARDWLCIDAEERPRDAKNNYDLTFCTYQRINKGFDVISNKFENN